jgi:hypothetical protein
MGLFTFLVLLGQLAAAQPTRTPLERVQARTPVDIITNLTTAQFAGQYTYPSSDLRKRVGPSLSGNDLYLFPDKTYVYCEWSDIVPTTVYDKGIWNVSAGILELKSDPEITWDPELERRFLVIHRSSRLDEILLVGVEKELRNFEQEVGDDREFMLLLVGRQRDTKISLAEAAKLKSRLMREAWRPEWFQKGQ